MGWIRGQGLPPAAPVRIAIVIVCLNMLEALKKTLHSIDALGSDCVETYIVDGASKDGTPAYLQGLAHPGISWTSERDSGIYDAMNKGWNMTPPHSYVLYLGAGDEILSVPTQDALQAHWAKGVKVVLGVCQMEGWLFVSAWTRKVFLHNTAHHQGMLVHRSVWPRSPFDTSFRVYGDWEFNARMFHSGVVAQADPNLVARAMPGGVSARFNFREGWMVAYRYGGLRAGVHSYLLNKKAVWLSARAERARASSPQA